jgi:hypothetical protein
MTLLLRDSRRARTATAVARHGVAAGRMAERSAHLIHHVFPDVPVRQRVLSLPHRPRCLLAWDHELCRAVTGVALRAVLGFARWAAGGATIKKTAPGPSVAAASLKRERRSRVGRRRVVGSDRHRALRPRVERRVGSARFQAAQSDQPFGKQLPTHKSASDVRPEVCAHQLMMKNSVALLLLMAVGVIGNAPAIWAGVRRSAHEIGICNASRNLSLQPPPGAR